MMRKANLIKDNRVSLARTYRNSFKGEDFIGWIMREKSISMTILNMQKYDFKHYREKRSTRVGTRID